VKIVDLDTEKGSEIMDALKADGWKKVAEYNPLAFDKGIDFDSYTLIKSSASLVFEWTNWFEWEVTGSREAVESLASTYGLKIEAS
jgi:hypothetical protein